jgi:beta-phosphoglucomutase-like phosphatase (HAD superfamily)
MVGINVLVDMDNVLVDTMNGYNLQLARMFPEIKIIP